MKKPKSYRRLASKIVDTLIKSNVYFLPKSGEYDHNDTKALLVKLLAKELMKELEND
jgi:hypothetical protein